MNYNVADIPADQLTLVIYAFAGVSASGECVSINAADDSINFPQLLQLKQEHPKLPTLISIGGAANSTHFPTTARNEESREKFARSCIQFMKQHGFDGIDIDWEYPNGNDKGKFTALLTELRRHLNVQGTKDNRQYLLTIAAPASPSHYANLDLTRIHPLVDWINLMSYDFTVVSSSDTDFVAPMMPYDVTVSEKHATSNVNLRYKLTYKRVCPLGQDGRHNGWYIRHRRGRGRKARPKWALGSFWWRETNRVARRPWRGFERARPTSRQIPFRGGHPTAAVRDHVRRPRDDDSQSRLDDEGQANGSSRRTPRRGRHAFSVRRG